MGARSRARYAPRSASRPDTSLGAHAGHQLCGQFPAVKALQPVLGQILQRGGKLGWRMIVPSAGTSPLLQEVLCDVRFALELLEPRNQRVMEVRGQREPIARQMNGRRKAARHRQPAVARGQQGQARGFPGDAGGQCAVSRQSRNRIALRVQVHIARGGRRRHFACIECDLNAIALPVQQVDSASRKPRAGGLDHRQGGTDRHRGVKGVAARPQYFKAGGGCQGMGACDRGSPRSAAPRARLPALRIRLRHGRAAAEALRRWRGPYRRGDSTFHLALERRLDQRVHEFTDAAAQGRNLAHQRG